MAKTSRTGTSKALTEIFAFLVCCVSFRKPKAKSSRVKNHWKDDNMNISANTVGFHLTGGAVTPKQVYPEYLNPFANDADEIIFTENQDKSTNIGVSDYPEYLNPFSDVDDE